MGFQGFGVNGGIGSGGGGGGTVPDTRRVNTTAPLQGGGDLSANRTLSISNFAGAGAGAVPGGSGADATKFLNGAGAWAVPAGGGGGGASFGTFASRPAGSDGDTYYATDLGIFSIKGGGVWQDFINGRAAVKIDNSTFSWVNQETTVLQDVGSIILSNYGVLGNHCRVKSAPATPYTITLKFRLVSPQNLTDGNYSSCGLLFRDSVSGKLNSFNFQSNTSYGGFNPWVIAVDQFTDAQNFNANIYHSSSVGIAIRAYGSYPNMCYKIQDDGTNRKYYYSLDDGQNFTLAYSELNNVFFTANQVGFLISANNSQLIPTAAFDSWEVA